MTGKEKIEAAFSAEGTSQIAAVICYEGIYIRDHWDRLTSYPWWYQFSPDIEHQLAWRREVIAKTPQDWLCLPTFLPQAEREAMSIEERPQGIFLVNRLSGQEDKIVRPLVGGWDPRGISRHIQHPRLPETMDDIDASIPIPGEFDAQQFVDSGRSDLAATLLDEFGSALFPICHTASPLWSCYGQWGFEGMMFLIAEHPELVRRACRRRLATSIARVREGAALGALGVWVEECMTDMISPAVFADLNVPVMQQLIDEIRALGMKSIYYYCGDPSDRWEHIFSLGMDALALEESKKGFTIDIEDVVDRVSGRCTVLGNLDAIGVLQDASDEQVRAEIARQVAAGQKKGGRFIMSLGSPVTPSTPVERVRLYCELVHELGR